MTVQYVEAPHNDLPVMGWPSVFLAGGITAVEDWRAQTVELLRASDVDMTVYNPRRAEFDVNNPSETRRQVAWEFIHLRTANINMFWFPASDPAITVQPIALFELGAAMERTQTLVVGVDSGYPRRLDIELQISNAQSLGVVSKNLLIHDTLENTVAATIGKIRRIHDTGMFDAPDD